MGILPQFLCFGSPRIKSSGIFFDEKGLLRVNYTNLCFNDTNRRAKYENMRMMVFDHSQRCVCTGNPALILFLYTFSRNILTRVGLTE